MTEPARNTNRILAVTLLSACILALILGVVLLTRAPKPAPSVSSTARKGFSSGLIASGNRLALISLDGMIMEDMEDSAVFQQDSAAVRARNMLFQAAEDNSVKGVLLRINSPGGTVGMSQELYQAVLTVRKRKPVVVSMGDVAASGGYYTAAAADKIVANPGTLTASIGVILHAFNAQELLNNKLGVKSVTVKSGRYKDILSPYRATTPDEYRLLQGLIDTSYRQFLRAVLVGRTMGMKDESAKALRIRRITEVADGRVVTGEEALRVGLVDALGGQKEATSLLQKLAGERFNLRNPGKLELEAYEPAFGLRHILGIEAGAGSILSLLIPKRTLTTPETALLHQGLRFANQPLWVMEAVR